jgi:XTP/dITP diphosphohydrolase
MPTTLHIATSNPGKLRDFAHAAEQSPFLIDVLPGLAHMPAPPEDAPTFAGNAESKALAYNAHAPELWVLADDSGLEVDALRGAPGVYSARYAERDGVVPLAGESTDARNNRHLLSELARTLLPQGLLAHQDHRRARFRCVLALAHRGAVVATAEGTLDGILLTEPRGTGGFGYDPLFLIPEQGRTMAELDPAMRLALSHRGQALRRLLAGLSQKETP